MKQYVQAESVNLVFGGENYFQTLIKLIDEAKDTLHLQTYIFTDDETGLLIAESLMKAAKRKVKVFMVCDAFGSKISNAFISHLNKEGIHFRFFSPFFSNENIYLGRRLHHKVVVADSKVALVGGINIADKYHGTNEEPPWLDYAVLIRGASCLYLHHLCTRIFEKRKFRRRNERQSEKIFFEGTIPVRFRRNDWVTGKNEIHRSYREALLGAEQSVIIVASYFLPGYFFKKLLKKTAQRGVEIKIVLPGKSDMPFFLFAERFLYRYLLNNRIRIYEWSNSVLHGKAIVADDEWSSIGSYNLNFLSRYRSIELNVDIMNKLFTTTFKSHLEELIRDKCTEITKKDFLKTNDRLSRIRNFIWYYYYSGMKIFLLPKKKNRV